MKQKIGLRPGAAEKVGLEIFTETLTTALARFEVDAAFDRRIEAVSGALIQGVFAGYSDLCSLSQEAVSAQFGDLNYLALQSAINLVVDSLDVSPEGSPVSLNPA